MGDLQQASPIPTNIPKGTVTEWGVDDVRNWLSQSMQLPQYLEQFEGTLPESRFLRLLELLLLVLLLYLVIRDGQVSLERTNCRERDCGGCPCAFGS